MDWNVSFKGELYPNVELSVAKKDFIKLTKLPVSEVDKIFSGFAVVLKSDLPHSEALELQMLYANHGIKVEIIPCIKRVQISESSLPPEETPIELVHDKSLIFEVLETSYDDKERNTISSHSTQKSIYSQDVMYNDMGSVQLAKNTSKEIELELLAIPNQDKKKQIPSLEGINPKSIAKKIKEQDALQKTNHEAEDKNIAEKSPETAPQKRVLDPTPKKSDPSKNQPSLMSPPPIWSISSKGRLDRLSFVHYFAVTSLPLIVIVFLLNIFIGGPVGFFLLVTGSMAILYNTVRLSTLRLQDVNIDGKNIIIAFAVLSGFFLIIDADISTIYGKIWGGLVYTSLWVLAAIPGDKEPNDYGYPSPIYPYWIGWVAMVCAHIFIIMVALELY